MKNRWSRVLTPDAMVLAHIERDAWLDVYDAATPIDADTLGLSSARLPCAGVVAAKPVGWFFFNRALAFGIDCHKPEESVDATVDWLSRHCGSVWCLNVPPLVRSSALERSMAANGLILRGSGTAKLFKPASRPSHETFSTQSGVRIVEVGGTGSEFGLAADACIGWPMVAAGWLARLCGRPGWHCFVALDGSTAVGCGAFYIKEGHAWLTFAGTAPDHRRKGIQRLLLAERMKLALALGAEWFVSAAVPPDLGGRVGSTSYRNLLAAGFVESHVDAAFVECRKRAPDAKPPPPM